MKKIVLIGPECTGKTTLARALADRLGGVYVPEYSRPYSIRVRSEQGRNLTLDDVMPIVRGQIAAEAGAAAIIVSNHGGRVLGQTPATAEVLAEIADAVGDSMKIFVDGGIRTGVDVFKALALGADGVLICRPFVTAVYGGGEEGVKCYIDKLAGELADTMQMCGAHSLAEITPDMVRV